MALLDIITPNEVEAAQLAGFPVKTEEDAFAAALLIRKGVAGGHLVGGSHQCRVVPGLIYFRKGNCRRKGMMGGI